MSEPERDLFLWCPRLRVRTIRAPELQHLEPSATVGVSPPPYPLSSEVGPLKGAGIPVEGWSWGQKRCQWDASFPTVSQLNALWDRPHPLIGTTNLSVVLCLARVPVFGGALSIGLAPPTLGAFCRVEAELGGGCLVSWVRPGTLTRRRLGAASPPTLEPEAQVRSGPGTGFSGWTFTCLLLRRSGDGLAETLCCHLAEGPRGRKARPD